MAVTLPADLAKKIARAQPPPRLPRGHFDPLMRPTRELMDRGFKLWQAADWFVAEGIIEPGQRIKFQEAMRGRLHRARAAVVKKDTVAAWSESLFFDSSHAVIQGGQALCGARASEWLPESVQMQDRRCTRCRGIITKQNVMIVSAAL